MKGSCKPFLNKEIISKCEKIAVILLAMNIKIANMEHPEKLDALKQCLELESIIVLI